MDRCIRPSHYATSQSFLLHLLLVHTARPWTMVNCFKNTVLYCLAGDTPLPSLPVFLRIALSSQMSFDNIQEKKVHQTSTLALFPHGLLLKYPLPPSCLGRYHQQNKIYDNRGYSLVEVNNIEKCYQKDIVSENNLFDSFLWLSFYLLFRW